MHSALGRVGEDRITGFKGTVTGYCEYISGCAQLLIVPKVNEKGETQKAEWFDEQRVALTSDPIRLDNSATPGCDMQAPVR